MNPISTRLCKSLKIGLPDWTFWRTLNPLRCSEAQLPNSQSRIKKPFVSEPYGGIAASLLPSHVWWVPCIYFYTPTCCAFRIPLRFQGHVKKKCIPEWVSTGIATPDTNVITRCLLQNLRKVTSCCETRISGKGRGQYVNTALKSAGLAVIDLKVLYLSIE